MDGKFRGVSNSDEFRFVLAPFLHELAIDKNEVRISRVDVKLSSREVRIEQRNRVTTEDIAFCACAKVDINLC